MHAVWSFEGGALAVKAVAVEACVEGQRITIPRLMIALCKAAAWEVVRMKRVLHCDDSMIFFSAF